MPLQEVFGYVWLYAKAEFAIAIPDWTATSIITGKVSTGQQMVKPGEAAEHSPKRDVQSVTQLERIIQGWEGEKPWWSLVDSTTPKVAFWKFGGRFKQREGAFSAIRQAEEWERQRWLENLVTYSHSSGQGN